ncbi:hypothetical protein Glove_360g69 [Diversispora epigaea]|uniref:MYND-type domain-containing protein n=1 Tax=Diversispora epigaea TaxID=1348612 RepID=A0A397HHI1_9GLOM|nr:hypothetical protein Glove_360g69 [Diversispora epigaea]
MESFLFDHYLKLESNPISYRSLISLRHIPKGTTVMYSYPLACLLIQSTIKTYCNQCLKIPSLTTSSSPPLQACSKCKQIFYCSVSCQKKSWTLHHKKLCSIYISKKEKDDSNLDINNNINKMDEEILRRVSLRIDKYLEKKSTSNFSSSSFSPLETGKEREKGKEINENERINQVICEAFLSLMSHRENLTSDQIEKYKIIAERVWSDLKFKNISQDDLIKYLCKFSCNNFQLHDNQLFTYGEGVYPVGSFINHSCHPNSIVMYEGEKQIIKSIEDIDAEEEITISYIDAAVMNRTSRKNILKEKYCFDCQCSRCLVNFINIEKNKFNNKNKFKITLAKIDQLMEKGSEDIKEEIIDDLIKNWSKMNNSKIESSLINNQIYFIYSKTSFILSSLLPHLREDTLRSSYLHSLDNLLNYLLSKVVVEKEEEEKNTFKLFSTTTISIMTKYFYNLIDAQRWHESWKLGKLILGIYLVIYPRYHPIITLHLFTLGKCMWNDLEGGKDVIKEAIDILKISKKSITITHGDGENNKIVLNDVIELLGMAEKELKNL